MMYGVPNMKTDKVRPQVNAALNHIAFISSSPPPLLFSSSILSI